VSYSSNENSQQRKTIGFLVAALALGLGLGEFGTSGITGQAVGSFEVKDQFNWSYDRNYVQYCVNTEKRELNHCILDATCQNLQAEILGEVFHEQVEEGIKVSDESQPFYWPEVSAVGDGTAMRLLKNLCADFQYWLPEQELKALMRNGIDELPLQKRHRDAIPRDAQMPSGEMTPGSEARPVGSVPMEAVLVKTPIADNPSNQIPGGNQSPIISRPLENVNNQDLQDFGLELQEIKIIEAGQTDAADAKYNGGAFPKCKGTVCVDTAYWRRGTMLTQEHCSMHFKAAVQAMASDRKLQAYMNVQKCSWSPDNQ
jgi:hypothetical protein